MFYFLNLSSTLRLMLFGLILMSCNGPKSENQSSIPVQELAKPDLIIYGSNSCDHCLDFKAKLDSLNIEYKFNDVEQDEALAQEMMNAVHSINYYDYIEFPVVQYGRQVFINPNLDQVLNVL